MDFEFKSVRILFTNLSLKITVKKCSDEKPLLYWKQRSFEGGSTPKKELI